MYISNIIYSRTLGQIDAEAHIKYGTFIIRDIKPVSVKQLLNPVHMKTADCVIVFMRCVIRLRYIIANFMH